MFFPLVDLLLAVTGSIVGRVLLTLGLTVATYSTISYTTDTLVIQLSSTYNSIPVNMAALLNMAGLGEVFGLVLGAYTSKAVLVAAKNVWTLKR